MIGRPFGEVEKPHGADAKSTDKASERRMSNVAYDGGKPVEEHRAIILTINGLAVQP